MVGAYQVRVKNSRNVYRFVIRRNLTVLCGDSGRGKTTLYEMIQEYNRFGRNSGVSISCDRALVTLEGADWRQKLDGIRDSIVVIDEDSRFIRSKDFAEEVRGSSNYYLLITRNYLSQLPYSVDEIYEVHGAKNKTFVPVYAEIEHMYDHPSRRHLPFAPEVIITEDSRSGFQFFSGITAGTGITCISADGKSNIYRLLKDYRERDTLVIADGAAFGAEIRNVVEQQSLRPGKLAIFLPESFEWLLLKSGTLCDSSWEKVEAPEQFADSEQYMSWEQYFTRLLMDLTKDVDYQKYTKAELRPFYLQSHIVDRVKEVMKEIRLS